MFQSEVQEFQQAIIDYYETNGRRFFWRQESLEEFDWLLLELLLKRTSAETVDNHAKEVLNRFSEPDDVVSLPEDELIDLIRPFGLYNRRSKNIRQVCQTLISEYNGQIPQDRESLLGINGIGEYVADAVLCFSFYKPVLVLDANTALVAEELFGIEPASDLRLDTEIRPALEPMVPDDTPREFNWGIIDIGAKIRKNQAETLPEFPVPDLE